MDVRKVNFTNIDINNNFTKKQQSKNITFTSVPKFNKTKTLLGGTTQMSENKVLVSAKNIFNKATDGLKNIFKKLKKALTSESAPKIRIVRTKDVEGNIVSTVWEGDIKKYETILEAKTENTIKYTAFNKDGSINYVKSYK